MPDADRSKTRLRGLAIHLVVYFVLGGISIVVNILVTPQTFWFVLPVVGWGAALALHVAYVMGLFDVFLDK